MSVACECRALAASRAIDALEKPRESGAKVRSLLPKGWKLQVHVIPLTQLKQLLAADSKEFVSGDGAEIWAA